MSDSELIGRIRAGKPGAVDELVEAYKDQLFAFIVRTVNDYHLAEDIFQETWIRVIRSVKGFRGDAKFSTWLFQIALNQCRDMMRKKEFRYTHVPVEDAYDLAEDPDTGPEALALRDLVKRAIDDLPPKMKEVVILKFYHDMDDAEIAEVVGCPVGTVKSRVHHATLKLRKKWDYLSKQSEV